MFWKSDGLLVGLVPGGHRHVAMSELVADVTEVAGQLQEPRRIGIAQILRLPLARGLRTRGVRAAGSRLVALEPPRSRAITVEPSAIASPPPCPSAEVVPLDPPQHTARLGLALREVVLAERSAKPPGQVDADAGSIPAAIRQSTRQYDGTRCGARGAPGWPG